MKIELITASLLLCATAVNAQDLYNVHAQLSDNGVLIGDYSAVVPQGGTVQFSEMQTHLANKPKSPADGTGNIEVSKPYSTGANVAVSLGRQDGPFTLIDWSVSYNHVDGTSAPLGAPGTTAVPAVVTVNRATESVISDDSWIKDEGIAVGSKLALVLTAKRL